MTGERDDRGIRSGLWRRLACRRLCVAERILYPTGAVASIVLLILRLAGGDGP